MKSPRMATESELVVSAADRMQKILEGVAPVRGMNRDVPLVGANQARGRRADFEIDLVVHNVRWKLLVEVKSSGEPRSVREAAWRLHCALRGLPASTYGIVAAPYLSVAAQEILREGGFGWLDMAGNCRIAFDGIHIDIEKATKNPFSTKRSLKSLYAPKSARLLRILLASPGAWKVSDLATRAGVSLGQVSKVRQALLEKEWAMVETGGGLHVHRPDVLLDAWRDIARPPEIAMRGYTLLHGKELEAAVRLLFVRARAEGARLQLASYSVARRLAPFARVAGEFFYADSQGAELIKKHLRVEPASKGENIVIFRPGDDMMWDEGIVLPHDLRGTSLVQTYLDLSASGDRGREAAAHFRRETMATTTRAPL